MKISTTSEICALANERSNSLRRNDVEGRGLGAESQSSSALRKMVEREARTCDRSQMQQAKALPRPQDYGHDENPFDTASNMLISTKRSPAAGRLLHEPQPSPIPSALRKLILKLGSNDGPRSFELKELQSPAFGTLFGGQHEFEGADQNWANLSAERVATMRLMLITAVGNCKTLQALNLGNSYKLPRFHLSLRELEELLEPLQSSEVFLELTLDGNEILETEDGSNILVRFLENNRSLQTLHIFDSALNPHIIDSLVANGHPTLRNLRLYLNPIEDGVFDTVRSILQACPELQEMLNVEWRCDDDEDAERWAEVLSRHDSFNAVELAGPVESLGLFLRRVLDSSCQLCVRKTLKKLKMMSLDDEYKQMPEEIVSLTVSANRNLEKVDLVGICVSSEEWQQILRTLKQNGVLRNLQLEDMKEGFDSGAWKELGALVEASSKLEVLKIHDSCNVARPSVQYLFQAMQINRSVKKIKLLLFGHEIDNEGVSALAKSLETNDVLEQLALDGCIISNWEGVFHSLRQNTKLRKLGLHSCRGLNDEAYRELLGALQTSSSFREIELSYTNWVTEGKKDGRWAILCEAIPVRERREGYMNVMREFWGPQSFEQMKAGRLFLRGSDFLQEKVSFVNQ